VLTERSRVLTERSRGGKLYTVDYRLGFARRAIAPSVSNRVVSASLDEQSPQVYRTESSRLRSTSNCPKCIEQNRLGFARRAIAPSVSNRIVSASLDEQLPHWCDIRRRRIPPRPPGTPHLRGIHTSPIGATSH
jgi:hypothetical protein